MYLYTALCRNLYHCYHYRCYHCFHVFMSVKALCRNICLSGKHEIVYLQESFLSNLSIIIWCVYICKDCAKMSNRPLMLQMIRYFYDLFFQLPLCSDLNLVFVWCPYFHGYFLQLRVTSSALRIAFMDNWTPCPPLSIP